MSSMYPSRNTTSAIAIAQDEINRTKTHTSAAPTASISSAKATVPLTPLRGLSSTRRPLAHVQQVPGAREHRVDPQRQDHPAKPPPRQHDEQKHPEHACPEENRPCNG